MCGWWPRRFNGITGAYGAMSDRTGHFSIATIRPGTYILLPERAGYLHVQAKGSTGIPNITIKPGEHVTGYQLEMTPRALISGRVVDEAGDPVQGVRVQTVAVTFGKYAGGHDAGSQSGDGRSRRVPTDGAARQVLCAGHGKRDRPRWWTGAAGDTVRRYERGDLRDDVLSLVGAQGPGDGGGSGGRKGSGRHRDPAGAAAAGAIDQRGGERISRRPVAGICRDAVRRKRAADHVGPQHVSRGGWQVPVRRIAARLLPGVGGVQRRRENATSQPDPGVAIGELGNCQCRTGAGAGGGTLGHAADGRRSGRGGDEAHGKAGAGDGVLYGEHGHDRRRGGRRRGVPHRQHRAGQIPGEGGAAAGERLHQDAGNRWSGGYQRHGRPFEGGAGSERQGDGGRQRSADFGPRAG